MPLTYVTKTASYRKNSDDRVRVLKLDDGAIVLIVADGAGGIGGAAQAADTAVREVEAKLAVHTIDVWSPDAWCDLLVAIDREIELDPKSGESTLVVAVVSESGRICGASVGDSGAMLFADDGSVDDLTEHQHRKRRLGSGRALPVGFMREQWNGSLLIATDGVWNYTSTALIRDVVVLGGADLEVAGDRIVDLVRLRSAAFNDDLALVLVRVRP